MDGSMDRFSENYYKELLSLLLLDSFWQNYSPLLLDSFTAMMEDTASPSIANSLRYVQEMVRIHTTEPDE